MAVTARNSSWGGSSANTSELLVSYITDVVRNLEPDLRYAQLGMRRDAPKGFDRILFPQTNQLAVKTFTFSSSSVTSGGSVVTGNISYGSVWGAGGSVIGDTGNLPVSSSFGVAAITEGTNPTAVTWGATSYGSGPYQYGILVQVTDLLVRNSAIETVDEATLQVKNALARMVDDAIAVVVNSGANGVIYAGGKSSRSTLAAGDTLTVTEWVRAWKYLASSNAAGVKPFDGEYYAAVIHPQVSADFQSATGAGNFVDVGRYTSVSDLKAGKIGGFRGIRALESAWQNYFQSTVNVFPTTVVGQNSFGWGYFQPPTPEIVTTPDSYNPLNLYTSIGGKVTVGATRFEDSVGAVRIVRIESAISN